MSAPADLKAELLALEERLLDPAVRALPAQVAVSKRGLKGLWASSPVFANDLSQMSWL